MALIFQLLCLSFGHVNIDSNYFRVFAKKAKGTAKGPNNTPMANQKGASPCRLLAIEKQAQALRINIKRGMRIVISAALKILWFKINGAYLKTVFKLVLLF